MSGSRDDELLSRVRRLTPREARVFLLADQRLTLQDLADLLGLRVQAVAAIRAAIRRKLAVPKGADIVDFLESPGARDAARGVVELGTMPTPADRRRNHVLRAAIRELDVLAHRVADRARALSTLTEVVEENRIHDLGTAEAEAVAALADQLIDLRDRAIAAARGPRDDRVPFA